MLLCPNCQTPIPPDDINIARDTALCRACSALTAVSSVVHGQTQPAGVFDPQTPPSGAWCRDDGIETVIGATTRSPMALFLVPFMLVWSGFSLGGIYGRQLVTGKLDLVSSLFGIPFLLGSVVLGGLTLLCVCGKAEVRLRQDEGTIFVGVGTLGWKRRFNVSGVQAIREDWAGWSSNRRPRRAIILEGATRISFGSMLNEPRRYFVLESLRRKLKLGP